MNYRAYVERDEKGKARLRRKSRKTERSKTFQYNKRLHSNRNKG